MEGHTCQTANVESQQFLRTPRGRSVAKASDWIWTESLAERTRSFPIWHASVALCAIWNLQELKAPDLNWRQDLSSDSSVFFGRSEEHQKFVAEIKLNWTQNQIGAPDQLHSEALILIWTCNRTTPKYKSRLLYLNDFSTTHLRYKV